MSKWWSTHGMSRWNPCKLLAKVTIDENCLVAVYVKEMLGEFCPLFAYLFSLRIYLFYLSPVVLKIARCHYWSGHWQIEVELSYGRVCSSNYFGWIFRFGRLGCSNPYFEWEGANVTAENVYHILLDFIIHTKRK